MNEEYECGYRDYVNSTPEARKVLYEQSHIRQDMYWQGVKAAYHNLELENYYV